MLRQVSFLDTPGILSGEKIRDYDNVAVLGWFAERADRILLFFDADKLDISDEFKAVIESFAGMEDKLRFVLNKCDMDHVELLRVYGSLMWNLGRVLKSPEVVKVYIGSFRENPLEHKVFEPLIESETQELLGDLQTVPRISANRKLGDLIKRAKKAKAHALVLTKLKQVLDDSAWMWFFESSRREKMNEIIRNLQTEIYDPLINEYFLSQEDFPEVRRMQKLLANEDFANFEDLDEEMLEAIEDWMDHGIAARKAGQLGNEDGDDFVSGGAFEGVMDPHGSSFLDYANVITDEDKKEAQDLFESQGLSEDGKVDSHIAKAEMVKSSLPKHMLQRIWKLSDVDRDSQLDLQEYKVVRSLMRAVLSGKDLPLKLPPHFFPDRNLEEFNDTKPREGGGNSRSRTDPKKKEL